MKKKFWKKSFEKKLKNGPHLSCNLHKIGANVFSKLPIAPYLCKTYGSGWVGGWMGGRAGLMIANSNQKIIPHLLEPPKKWSSPVL